jgi:hypothetical protein
MRRFVYVHVALRLRVAYSTEIEGVEIVVLVALSIDAVVGPVVVVVAR